MFAFTYAAAIIAVIYTVMAAAFLIRERRALTVIFAGYMLSAAAWIGGNAIADISYTPEALLMASQFAFAFGMLNVFFFLLFTELLVQGRFPTRLRLAIYALPNLIVFLLAFTPYAVVGMSFPAGRPAEITPGFPYSLALLILLTSLIYTGVRLYRVQVQEQDYQRRAQVLYVFAGLIGTLIGQIFFDLLLPLLGETRFYTLGPISSLFFVLGCGYAITRHKFINMRLVVRMLEQKVEERTREIRALQEEQRRMMIELSHNLQTPLAILKSKLERARQSLVMDGELRGLEQSVDDLSSFIYDLLELSSLERTLKEEDRETFSLTRLLEDVAEEVTVIADSSGVQVRSNLAPGIEVYGNEKRLREAVMNLASNALKYMRDSDMKEVRFTLETGDDVALIHVADTGIGIGLSDLPRVFERFYRGSQAYDTVSGTGLGLAIVDRIVKEHGGTITVASELGAGSTFTIRLPLRTADS